MICCDCVDNYTIKYFISHFNPFQTCTYEETNRQTGGFPNPETCTLLAFWGKLNFQLATVVGIVTPLHKQAGALPDALQTHG